MSGSIGISTADTSSDWYDFDAMGAVETVVTTDDAGTLVETAESINEAIDSFLNS